MSCPTVKVEDGKGSFIIINESDFDSSKHKKYNDKPVKKVKAAKADK